MIGAYNLLQFSETLEASAMAAMTRILHWTRAEVDVLIEQARRDARNPEIHGYFDL
jgi:hypothetical protein